MKTSKPLKILHTADFHINSVQSGIWNPESGLPERMMDFLKSVDVIIDTAIEEKVDIVLVAGDIYKNNSPNPAHQAAFDRRILRLEEANISTYLLVGNHDKGVMASDHALTEFKSFNTQYIRVVEEIELIKTEAFDMACLPWIHKSHLVIGKVIQQLEELIEKMDPETPNIFLGHCSVVGARFSSELLITLGEDLMLPLKLLTESGFDYVALGHIHKHQVLNDDPLVIYPGSVEKVDWGESGEDKGFVIADVRKDSCDWEFRQLETRPMLDYVVELYDKDTIMDEIGLQVPSAAPGDMIRIKLQYPEHWAGLIHNQTIEQMFPKAFSVNVVHEPIREGRTRLDLEQEIASYTPDELLKMWLEEKGTPKEDQEELLVLANDLFGGIDAKDNMPSL